MADLGVSALHQCDSRGRPDSCLGGAGTLRPDHVGRYLASITEIGDEDMNMLKKWCNQRYLGMLAAPLMLVGVLAGLGPGTAAAVTTPCESWAGTQPPSPGTADNGLSGVTVLSACNAWAVGAAGGGSGNQALIEHWNGAT